MRKMKMNKVLREEIVDYVSYGEKRSETRKKLIDIKEQRRIHVGENLTFLFENRDTVKYQVQEMMWVEKIVREKDILHEIETYNELIGQQGELGCTLLIEIDSQEKRTKLLVDWMGLPEKIYGLKSDGTKVRADFDHRQVGEERLSSVQYLKFNFGEEAPVALGVDHPKLNIEISLNESQRDSLQLDLNS